MTTTNGVRDRPTVAGDRPVALVRYRPGITGEASRVVHLMPLPFGTDEEAAALCGALLRPSEAEIVAVGQGMPCGHCLISQVASSPPPLPQEPAQTAHPGTSADGYQKWGWSVTVRRDQVQLNLEPDAVALIIPALVAARVTEILADRRYPPPVLIDPGAPEHWVLLAGERFPVPLPWSSSVTRITTALVLPPTPTPYGPLRWVHPPHDNSLKLCREIDVLAAMLTAFQRTERAMRGNLDA